MRITRVYTLTGDDGTTGLANGNRVAKNDPRIEAYGTTDELSTILGWVRQELAAEKDRFAHPDQAAMLDQLLEYIGNQLFTVGADLATPLDTRHPQMQVVCDEDIKFLENVCDRYNAELPPLKDFILPGGSRTGAALHIARTVARRAERAVVTLAFREEIGPYPGRYLNRVSDALFVLARWTNREMNAPEPIWRRDLPKPPLP